MPKHQHHVPAHRKFNATPRFTFVSTPRPSGTQTLSSSTPFTPRFATPVLGEGQDEDVIEDGSDDLPRDVYESVEEGMEDGEDEIMLLDAEEEYMLEQPDRKRRRLSASPVAREDDIDLVSSSSLPTLSSPPAKSRGLSTAPRFLPATPAPASTPQVVSTQGQTFLKPPRFRPPGPAEQTQTQTELLPDQFSPHRRGQKYIPGGLDAEVRDWLFNMESTVSSTSAHRSKEDPWTFKLIIDEVSGGERAGFTIVRGRQVYKKGPELEEVVDELGEVKMLLAGEGAGTGIQKGAKVEVGRTVGVKGPIWEILLEGVKWGVGTDWKVLL